MKKWQELIFTAIMNFSVALMAGGVLKMVLDFKSIVSSVVVFFVGIYILFAVTITAKNIDEGIKMDALAYFAVISAVIITIVLYLINKADKNQKSIKHKA